MGQFNNFGMKRTVSVVALCMLIGFASGASLKDSDRSIVKRDVEIIPAVFSGAVDMTLDLLDRFGKGFAMRGSSKTDVGALGLHDERNFETGVGDAIVPQEREKRSAAPCNGNKTATNNSRVNTRNASNPDLETLARRKRSADVDALEMAVGEAMVPQEREKRSAAPCNGNKTATNNSRVNTRNASNPDVETLARRKRSADVDALEMAVGEAMVPQEREKRSPVPCNNASNIETPARRKRSAQSIDQRSNGESQNEERPSDQTETKIDSRSKRSPQGQNDDFPQGSNQNGGRPQQQRDPNGDQNRDRDQNMDTNRQQNWGQNRDGDQNMDTNRQQNWGQNRDGDQNMDTNGQQNWDNENRNRGPPRQGQNMQNDQQNLNGYGSGPGENYQSENTNSRLKKRSAKPCNGNGNGQPIGAPSNNVPSQQLPQPQQPQQQQVSPAGGVNIADLQRDQNQRRRRGVNDPDKVLPSGSDEDKNLFERVVQVAKEIVARITKWGRDMDNDQAAVVDPKNPK